jgi:hypothetical protein
VANAATRMHADASGCPRHDRSCCCVGATPKGTVRCRRVQRRC